MLMLFGQAAPLPPLHVFGSRSSWWVPSRVDSRRRRRRLLGRRGLPSGAGPEPLRGAATGAAEAPHVGLARLAVLKQAYTV